MPELFWLFLGDYVYRTALPAMPLCLGGASPNPRNTFGFIGTWAEGFEDGPHHFPGLNPRAFFPANDSRLID